MRSESTPSDDLKRTTMPTYTRVTLINSGGQGEVWRGTADDGTEVAIKYLTIAGPPAQQALDRARFQKEITCQTSLLHENVMPILAVNMAVDPPFFVMPVADGSLRDRLLAPGSTVSATTGLPTGRALPEAEAVAIFDKVVDAVVYAHSEGVLHRDLKPENILFIGGEPMLSDFGLGRRMFSGSTTLTLTNAAMGTFAYGAPEQFTNAHAADERADVFALGRIFYEMLTGQFAFVGMDLNLVPAKFRYIIMKATQNQPAQRFTSVSEMQRELALLTSGGDALMAPGERAKELVQHVAAGATGEVPALARLLVENTEDLQLYLHVLPGTPATVLAALAVQTPTEFREIMRVFDRYADSGFPWSFTDTLATFLRAAFRATSDLEIRQQIIERLLVLGFSHNRFFVRSAFLEVVSEAFRDPVYTPIIAGILRGHPDAIDFVRDGLEEMSLPQVILDLLAA